MKFRHLIFAAVGAFALIGSLISAPQPALAGQAILCSPEVSGASAGPKRVVNPNTSNAYSLDGAGCAVIALADIGYFRSLGYVYNTNLLSLIVDTGVVTGTADINLGNIPAGAYIREIIVENKTATAVTGGIAFGTTANATDVVTALTCGASCLAQVTDANLKLRVFSTSTSQAIHASAVTTWQNARAIITVIYSYF